MVLKRLLDKFTARRQRLEANYALLRQVLDAEALKIEAMSYEALQQPAEVLSFSRELNGQVYYFSLEAIQTLKNGDLEICIDIGADDLPTKWGVKPSYHFYKRPDGSIYY